MKFSIVMPIYNHYEHCERAILSIINQTYTDWELILLDNASEDARIMQLITTYQGKDSRVKGFRIEENVGWPKGVALCLEKAAGTYMGFLAADDFLELDGLQNVIDAIGENSPTIIWMGNKEDYIATNIVNDICPPELHLTTELDICSNLINFFQTVYYNAMHHFVDITFLRKYNIDFFFPYYSDCGAMTRALGLTDNMIVLPQSPYHLVRGTSHSTGKYRIHSYDMFIRQFQDIQEKLFRTGYFDLTLLQYIAKRFENNHISGIQALCLGGTCQDDLFNTVPYNWSERLSEIENVLKADGMEPIIYYYDSFTFFNLLENSLLTLINHALQEQYTIEEITKDCTYLNDIILALFSIKDNQAYKKESLTIDDIARLFIAVLNENNRLLFGYDYIHFLILNNDQTINDLFSKAIPVVQYKYAHFLETVISDSIKGYSNYNGIISSYRLSYEKHCNDIINAIEDLNIGYKMNTELKSLLIQLTQGGSKHESN